MVQYVDFLCENCKDYVSHFAIDQFQWHFKCTNAKARSITPDSWTEVPVTVNSKWAAATEHELQHCKSKPSCQISMAIWVMLSIRTVWHRRGATFGKLIRQVVGFAKITVGREGRLWNIDDSIPVRADKIQQHAWQTKHPLCIKEAHRLMFTPRRYEKDWRDQTKSKALRREY